jgi:hypothetical protein
VDKALFFSSTYIVIGDGKNTPLWDARWLLGSSPKQIAPNLYKLTRFKNRFVHLELKRENWIRNLGGFDSPELLEEFFTLHMAISSVNLSEHKDQIFWAWTPDRKYLVATTYKFQFHGAMVSFPASHIWSAIIEPKCRFFAWLALHNRILTADNMLKKNWDYNPNCSLCLCLLETTDHLLAKCNFVEAVWNIIASHFHLPNYDTMRGMDNYSDWITLLISNGSKKQKRVKLGILFTFW